MLPPLSSGIPPKNMVEGYYNYVKTGKEKARFTRLFVSVLLLQSFLRWMSFIHNWGKFHSVICYILLVICASIRWFFSQLMEKTFLSYDLICS